MIGCIIIMAFIAYVDCRKRIIDNRLILIGLIYGLVVNIVDKSDLMSLLIHMLLVFGVSLVIKFCVKDGLGMGDVKMFGMLSLYYDSMSLIIIVTIAMLLVCVYQAARYIIGFIRKEKYDGRCALAPFVFVAICLAV